MNTNTEEVLEEFTVWPAEKYFLVDIGGETGFWLLLLSILILSVITYKLGFAKKLALAKSLIIYILLIIGCVMLTLFTIIARLPMIEVLAVITLVLAIYRFRLHRERKAGNK
ncbi:YlaH-like family protein [Bacillaceae bacterium W0354]